MSLHAKVPSTKRFSREGFQPIPTQQQANMAPNDATIDIPLEQVPSHGGTLRNQNSMSALQPSQTMNSQEKRRHMFRGRRQKPEAGKKTGKTGYDGEEDTITTMGKIYTKILNFSIVTRYFVYVLPLALIIAVPIIVGATAAQHAAIGGVRIVWFFTWIEIVWLSLWVSKIVAHFLPSIFQILVGVVNSGIRKYAMVLRALEIPLSLVGWALTSLATFMPLMTKNPTQRSLSPTKADPNPHDPKDWENIVQKILAAALVCSLVYLAEKLIIQLISINYHRKQFNSRIKESKHNVWLLSLLYDASRALFPAYCNEFAEEDYVISDQLNISLGLSSKERSHARSGSHTPARVLQDIGRYGDKLTSAFGNVAHEITGREVFNPNSSHSIVIEALEKNRSSEALARRIWMSFVVEGRESLLQEDIADVLGPERRIEAEECFAALDRDGNGDVSLDEMILTVTEWSRDRKSIATSMHDVDQAINVLDRLLLTVVFIAVVFIFVAFLNANFTTTLATTGTALLSLSFVFAATAQEVLGSCIFLFVKHPFDIGDRVDVGADQFTVEHISLLYTNFRRVTGTGVGRSVQVPNIVLNNLWIENVSRSKAMTEQLTVDVAFDTSFDDIQLLKTELQTFVTDKDNSRDFQPNIDIEVLGTSDMSKLQLRVEVRHKSNWSNETIRAARRSKFMCALVSALRAVPINGPGGGGDAQGSAANPSYSVSVSDAEARNNVAKSALDKDAKRMVPKNKLQKSPTAESNKSGSGAGLTRRENRIVDDLNSRNPAIDESRDEAWTSSREDASTLGERPSIDRQDLEDVRGLLRRESTRGKRKTGYDTRVAQVPSVPTISEPQGNTSYADYAQPAAGGYENVRPTYSAPSAYQPPSRHYGAAASNQSPVQSQSMEMRQVARSPSNPYRQQQARERSESITRKPLSPTAGPGERNESSFENTRPYSGV